MQRTYVAKATECVSEKILLQGWVSTKRDHGKLTFIDLRDKTGVVQCVGFKMMGELTAESVIEVIGEVKARPETMINTELPTGSIEVSVESYTVLNKSEALPIPVEGDGGEIAEELRLKYRYLDLRRERMRKNLEIRSSFAKAFRHELSEHSFTEVETPMLTKSTKEGSRDFIVPSRFQPGKFYALPQSPQQYKQLLMTAGVERYFQFARCIRDEDLRADRGFEHTQIDMELSFVERDDVMNTIEEMLVAAVSKVGGKLKDNKFPVITYAEAIETYGADKFDLRTEEEKAQGVLAFAWVIDFPFFKKVDTSDKAEVEDGKSGWTFTHNPFSMPKPEHLEWHLTGEHVEDILTTQYDLVCNGFEAGGGSIRAHRADILEATYKIMGYSQAEIQDGIGHMLEAFKVGTPPHGGIALGLDRLAMVLSGEKSLKDTVAFPMTSTGRTAVMDAPSLVGDEQLHELKLTVTTNDLSPYEYIIDQLTHQNYSFSLLSHKPVYTSQEAADIRGESIEIGAKALVLQADKQFILYVVPGDKRADLEKLQSLLGVKKLAMASKESITAKTGLEVGCIPPFGSSIKLPTYIDTSLTELEKIAFNPGRHDKSIVMKTSDYLQIERPTVV